MKKFLLLKIGFFALFILIVTVGLFFLKGKQSRERVFPVSDQTVKKEVGTETTKQKTVKKIKRNYKLKIGFLTDLHCYSKHNKDTGRWELNWRCVEPLRTFIERMNKEFEPDFVIDGGDIVDGRDKRGLEIFKEVQGFYQRLIVPYYYVLGNHEVREFTKKEWLDLVGYEKTYYYFDVKGYRIIVLDGNYGLDEKGKVIDTSPKFEFYPGLLNRAQLNWLKSVFAESRGIPKLVFIHQPPIESTTIKGPYQLFIEGEKLRKLFSDNGVLAVFSGHIEELCFLKYDGVQYYVLEGVHKPNLTLPKEKPHYKDMGVFYEITIDEEDKLEVKMFYKKKEEEQYQEMIVKSENSVCNNETVLTPDDYERLLPERPIKVNIE